MQGIPESDPLFNPRREPLKSSKGLATNHKAAGIHLKSGYTRDPQDSGYLSSRDN